MAAIAHVHYDAVRFIVTASQEIQSGHPLSVPPQAANWEGTEIGESLRPLLSMVPHDRSASPSREELADAVRTASENLAPLVGDLEKSILQSASARMRALIGDRGERRVSRSGIYLQSVDDEEGTLPLDLHVREAVFLSIGGALHDADKTLTALSATVQISRRYRPEVLQLAIGSETVDEVLRTIESQTRCLLELIYELRGQIDSMKNVVPDTANDLKALLLSGGYVDRIFGQLAKVRLFLGRVQRRMMAARGQPEFHDDCWKLFDSVLNGIEFTKLTASLFRGLLDIQRLYEETEDPRPINPHAHLRRSMLQSVLGEKIRLDMEGLDPDPGEIRGPSVALWRLVINLASNARRAMNDFGTFQIATRKITLTSEEAEALTHQYVSEGVHPGDYIRFTVRDTGPGIAASDLPKIFRLFYSGRNSSGYGLAVTHTLVREMGGFLGVDSETDGPARGTTFTIYLPR